MANSITNEMTIAQILHRVSQSDRRITLEQCQFVWEAFNKATVTFSQKNTSLLIFDMFLISSIKEAHSIKYILRPTVSLCDEIDIKFDQIANSNIIMNFSRKKLSQSMNEKIMHSLDLTTEIAWAILQIIFRNIKEELKNRREIFLDFLGAIGVDGDEFYHIFKEDTQVRIRKLKTPKRKSSLINSYSKMFSENVRRESHELSFLSDKRNSAFKSNPFKEINNTFPEKRWINQLIVPDTRISDDLLGAGIDPLKFDYNYSKLVSNTTSLFHQTFLKPKPAKMRHPGIIDKFERTSGVPQAGLKVSNSIILRIGANYNPNAKRLYIDTKARRIMLVPKELKITLGKKNILKTISATQQEEYLYLIGQGQQLEAKVEQRRKIYKRYEKYLTKFIGNQNVSPMSPETIKRILKQLHAMTNSTVKHEHNNEYFNIAQKTLNQGNLAYFQANKKAILDYILKDQNEKERTGIECLFQSPVEWGQNKKKTIIATIKKEQKQKISKSLQGYLYFPKCIIDIAEINLRVKEIDLFMCKSQIIKPVNVLYFIKKQKTQSAEIISYLGSQWIKNIVQVIRKHISVPFITEQKVTTFIKLINVILSNTLKSIVRSSLEKLTLFFRKFSTHSFKEQTPILQVSVTDDNHKFVLTDDFRKILTEEITQIMRGILEETSKIHSIEFYLRDDPNSFLNALSEQDFFYKEALSQIMKIIDENCKMIEAFISSFEPCQQILLYKEEINQWTKENHCLEEVLQKLKKTYQMEKYIDEVPHCYKQKMFSIECFEEKEKLRNYLRNIKMQLYQNLESSTKNGNFQNFSEIEEIRQKISANIENTSDYIRTFTEIEKIKSAVLPVLRKRIYENRVILMNLLEMDYGYISTDLIQKIYRTTLSYKSLPSKIQYHEQRLEKQKLRLEKKLTLDIKEFETKTAAQLTSINSRLQQFQIRRIYNDYLIEIDGFKEMVDENDTTIGQLIRQQQDLKWKKVEYKSADQLKGLVLPSLELWRLVMEFDSNIKQWKNIAISKMQVRIIKEKTKKIIERASQLQLKNLSSMKICSQLQTDCKQILNQQLQIIEIFSHPGLKDRHWQVFNSKLMIPGYDLKQITYSKIKIFYEYEKILKILSVVSKQAAREFEIEREKKSQEEYWSDVTFSTYVRKSDNAFCISEHFLKENIRVLEQNFSKLSVMKNYLYSKTLYQQISEWEVWLTNSSRLMSNLKSIQDDYLKIKGLFIYDNIAKQLPIEYSQFEAVESAWKTLSKKIFEHSKFIEFSKSSKIIEFTEETIKKLTLIKGGIPEFLKIKRNQFPRFFFIEDDILIEIIAKGVYSLTEDTALEMAFERCFMKGLTLLYNKDRILEIRSSLDSLIITTVAQKVRAKNRICETMNLVSNSMKISVFNQIENIFFLNNQNEIEILVKSYTLTAIFCCLNIQFTKNLQSCKSSNEMKELIEREQQKVRDLIELMKEEEDYRAKAARVLVSVLGTIDILRSYEELDSDISSSFEFKSELKFEKKGVKSIKSQNSIASSQKSIKSISRAQKVYRKIRNTRRVSMSYKSEGKIYIQSFNKQIIYGLEYWGSQADNFRPLHSPKFILNMFANFGCTTITHSINRQSSIGIKFLAGICGKFYKLLKSEHFCQKQGFISMLRGAVSTGGWITADLQKMQLPEKHLECINAVYQEIQAKLQYDNQLQTEYTTKKSIFLNKLNQIVDIDQESVFIIQLPQAAFTQIPESHRTKMRTISYCPPSFFKYLQTELIQELQEEKIQIGVNLRIAAQLLKFNCEIDLNQSEACRNYEYVMEKFDDEDALLLEKYELMRKHFYDRLENVREARQIYEEMRLLEQYEKMEDGDESLTGNRHFARGDSILNKDRVQYKQFIDSLLHELNSKFESNDSLLFVGSLQNKHQIILSVIKKWPHYKNLDDGIYSYPISHFYGRQAETLQDIAYRIHRATKCHFKKNMPQVLEIPLWLQYETSLEQHTLARIISGVRQVEKKKVFVAQHFEYQGIRFKIIFDCLSLKDLSPITLFDFPKVFIQIPSNLSLGRYMSSSIKKFIQDEKIIENLQACTTNSQNAVLQLESFESNFQQILSGVLKARSAKLFNSPLETKMMLANNFINMIKLFFNQIKNKCYEVSCIDFDLSTYLSNAMLYCSYWTFCCGYLDECDHYQVEECLMKDHFSEINEIESVSKYFLNQDNEWLVWSSLREEFSLNASKNSQIYNIWISTEQNMKVYMNLIKFLEFNLSIIITGLPCSGRSTLLRELNNFQISKDSVLLSCYPGSSCSFIRKLLTNQIYYKTNNQKLILIDDMHLPLQEKQIGQTLKKLLIQKKLAINSSESQKIINKNTQFSSLIISYASHTSKTHSYSLLRPSCQQINLGTMSESQIFTIFKTYIKIELEKTCVPMESVQMYTDFCFNYFSKINRKLCFGLHTFKNINKILIEKLRFFSSTSTGSIPQSVSEESEPQKNLNKNTLLNLINVSVCIGFSRAQELNCLKFLMEESNKIANGTYARDFKAMNDSLTEAMLLEIPPQLENSGDFTNLDPLEKVGKLIEASLLEKQNFQYLPTSELTRLVFNFVHILKGIPSHAIYLTEGSYGARTTIRLACFLGGISFTEIDEDNCESIVNDCVNIIKAGGRIDQSTYYISRKMFNKIKNLQTMEMINCFISEPELHSFFNEKRIEQVFVKFSSEKKAIRRNEFVKKVKDKIDELFHFVLNVNMEQFGQLALKYPEITKISYLQKCMQFPVEALMSYGQKIITKWRNEVLPDQSCLLETKIIKTMVEIKKQFNEIRSKVKSDLDDKFQGSKISYFRDISMIQYFRSVSSLFKRLQNVNGLEEGDSQIWQKRTREAQSKYQNLLKEKEKIVEENNNYFEKNNKFGEDLQQKQMRRKYLMQQIRSQENERREIYEHLFLLQNQEKSNNIRSQTYERLLDVEGEMLEVQNKLFVHIYEKQEFKKLREQVEQTTENTGEMEVDIKSKVMEVLEKCRLSRNLLIQEFNLTHQYLQNNSLATYFSEWMSCRRKLIEQSEKHQEEININQSNLCKIDSKIESLKSHVNEVEDELAELRQQFTNEFPDSTSTAKKFQEISKAVTQTQSILNIFNHFNNVMKRRKSQNKHLCLKSPKQYIGNIIYAATYITFSYYLKDDQLLEFLKSVSSIIFNNKFELDQDNLFECFLGKEEKFRYKNTLVESHQNHIILHVVISLNLCTVIAIDDPQNFIQFYNFIREMSPENSTKIVEYNDQHMIPNYLTTGQKMIIIDPSQHLVKKLKPLIDNQGQMRNNNVYINLQQEILLNPESRVIFVFTQQKNALVEKYFGEIWHMRFISYPQNPASFAKSIKKQFCLLQTNTNKLVQEYSRNCEDLVSIEKKIENLIVNIRKNIDNPDNLIIKIESVSEEKDKILSRMEDITENLKKIEKEMQFNPQLQTFRQCINELLEEIVDCKGIGSFCCLQFLRLANMNNSFKNEKTRQNLIKVIRTYKDLFALSSYNNILNADQSQSILSNFLVNSMISDFREQEKEEIRKNKWGSLLACFFKKQTQEEHNSKTTEQPSHQILILKSQELDAIETYLTQIFIELNNQIEACEIDSLKEISLSQSFKEKIIIIKVKFVDDWEMLLAFLRQQTLKCVGCRIVIICSSHLRVPYQLKLISGIIKNNREVQDLINHFLTVQPTQQLIQLIQNSSNPKRWTVQKLASMKKILKEEYRNIEREVKFIKDIL